MNNGLYRFLGWEKNRFSKEHIGEVFYRFAFEHNGIVFPMAETIDAIDVFISEVEAPTKGRMAVDHNHFAVVAVI